MATKGGQIGIFDQVAPSAVRGLNDLDWPAPERFPVNIGVHHVRDHVVRDLVDSTSPLIVAGYAAIDHIVELLAQMPAGRKGMRLLFGSEPSPGRPDRYGGGRRTYPEEVQSYWLEHGISVRLSFKLIQAIERLERGEVEARFLGDSGARLHAKIYLGERAVTLGSSNFTEPGLVSQLEANVRFTAAYDSARYRDTALLAENYWSVGSPFNQELIRILQSLLRWVDWQEALARACAELLEGEWAREYAAAQLMPGDRPLWPAQQQGIAQALWILNSVGSVLVADATGSGKTRLGAHLMRAVADRAWRSGRVRRGLGVLVAPPSVAKQWEREARLAGTQFAVSSHGRLSYRSSGDHDDVVETVRRAQILAVDEAHNFLNPASMRSRVLLGNMADHTILFTATPINRSTVDLLRLADMLGADNLAEETLKLFEKLLRRPKLNRSLSEHEQQVLRKELERFTVRRTKAMFNEMVDREPEKYRDLEDQPCRYPTHVAKTYPLLESEQDRALAAEIRREAESLAGVGLIVAPIEMPEVLRSEGWSEEKYLQSRLSAASKLSAYLVMAALRSSKWALVEHLRGTESVLSELELAADVKRQSTGDMIGKLTRLAGHPPGSKLAVNVPTWLTEIDPHRAQCEADVATYGRILTLVRKLSDRREMQKVTYLRSMLERHSMVVAFDSRPLSLAVFADRLAKLAPDVEVILATGEHKRARRDVAERMQRGAKRSRLIALCSDSMSEGVNLQEASAVLHLDMPSVVRVAEQRVGRVDRMDSPHRSIEVRWPDDADEFALRTDERFLERYETVETLLGSNLPLPERLLQSRAERAEVVKAETLIEESGRAEAEPWDGIRDAFTPVRDLVSGEAAIVPAAVYRDYRYVTDRVLSRVSCVESVERWALLCFAGSSIGAPRWVLCEGSRSKLVGDLPGICSRLRGRLDGSTRSLPPSKTAVDWLAQAVEHVHQAERSLLPRRKRRALEEMEIVLGKYQEACEIAGDFQAGQRLGGILDALTGSDLEAWLDWDAIAERWLDLIRPVWYERLTARKRLRPLLLKDVRSALLGDRKLDLGHVFAAFSELPRMESLDQRLAACILGVKE